MPTRKQPKSISFMFQAESRGKISELSPIANLIGIGPEEIAEEALVGNVRRPHDATNLLHRAKIG